MVEFNIKVIKQLVESYGKNKVTLSIKFHIAITGTKKQEIPTTAIC